MKISEVAAAAGVNVQTIRYYERRGLLAEPPRTESGHRRYGADTVRVVKFVKSAQELGFSLAEIEDLLSLRDADSADRERVSSIAYERLRDVREKIERLRSIESALADLVEECTCSSEADSCPILASLEPSA